MRRPNRRKLARWLPLTALAVMASCGLPFQPGRQASKVDVDQLSTDILFGVPSPSPAQSQAGAEQAALPPMTLNLPEQPADLGFGNEITFPTLPAPAACPTAPSTAFPADVATSDVTKMPASGSYRWAAGGQYQMMVLTTSVKIPLPMFEQRVVRHATQKTDTVPTLPGSSPDFVFTYETIEPRVSDGSALLLFWQVKASAATGDPEGGLALTQVDSIDKNGKDTGTIFKGTPGLLFMPLPAQPGASISSTAVDSSGNANNLQLKGTVGNRERVDACGTPIQAWGVDAQLTGTGASAASPATLHYDVATQMGALVVAFNIDGPWFNTTFIKETARIGQTSGDPVPDQYK